MFRTGATRRNLQAQPKILKKLPEHQIYQSKRKFSQKKDVEFLKSVKEAKIRMGATRRNLPREPQKPRFKGKRVMRITKFADRRQTDGNFFFVKNHFFIDKKS
jgi:hypothetical protein